MRYTAKQYAQTLFELTDSNPRSAQATIKRVAEILLAHNQGRLLRKIETEFEREWNARKGITQVEVTATKKGLVHAKDFSHRVTGKIELTETIDPQVIGGVKIKIGDWQIDNTIARRLKQLQEAIAK